MQDPKNRDFITLLKYISDDRLVISNMIILNRKNHLKKFFFYNNLDGKFAIGISNIEYNNNKFSFYWLEHFDKYIYKKKIKILKIFIINGISNHIYKKFI